MRAVKYTIKKFNTVKMQKLKWFIMWISNNHQLLLLQQKIKTGGMSPPLF